jgi:hypothetical protein
MIYKLWMALFQHPIGVNSMSFIKRGDAQPIIKVIELPEEAANELLENVAKPIKNIELNSTTKTNSSEKDPDVS